MNIMQLKALKTFLYIIKCCNNPCCCCHCTVCTCLYVNRQYKTYRCSYVEGQCHRFSQSRVESEGTHREAGGERRRRRGDRAVPGPQRLATDSHNALLVKAKCIVCCLWRVFGDQEQCCHLFFCASSGCLCVCPHSPPWTDWICDTVPARSRACFCRG